MATSLTDLLATTTENDVLALLIGQAQTLGLATTDWEPGSPELQIMEMVAQVVNDLVTSVRPVIVGGGFVDTATGTWLTLNSHERYNLDRTEAVTTVGYLQLTVAAGAGPYPLTAGTMQFLSASGKRFTGPTGASPTINTAQNGTNANRITITAESPGAAYNVPADTITTIATPLPGVTCTNPAAAFSAVVVDGTSQGTIAPSGTVAAATWIVLITLSGQRGTAQYQLSNNGGATFGANHTSPIGGTVNNVDGTGLTLVWTNNATVTPSFVAGDRFAFTTPDVWYTTTGADEESDTELRIRDKARWPSLADVPTQDKYALWALTASPNVRQVKVSADPATAATVNIVIAGDGAVVTNAEKTVVENYIEPRTPVSDLPVVSLASALGISLTGATVTVKLSLSTLAQAQTDAQQAYEVLMSGYRIADTVRWAEVLQTLMDVVGIIDCTGLLVNGAVVNIALASNQIASATSTLASSLTWTVVP